MIWLSLSAVDLAQSVMAAHFFTEGDHYHSSLHIFFFVSAIAIFLAATNFVN
jgi:hypothetical protein